MSLIFRERPARLSWGLDPLQLARDLWDVETPVTEQTQVSYTPRFDVREAGGVFVFQADLPGVAEKDLDISLNGTLLTVSGKRESDKAEQTDTYYAAERNYGSFVRAFTLPETVDPDKLRAGYDKGTLTITIGKKEVAKPRSVKVNVATAA